MEKNIIRLTISFLLLFFFSVCLFAEDDGDGNPTNTTETPAYKTNEDMKKDAGQGEQLSDEKINDAPQAGSTNAQPSQEVKKDASKAGSTNAQPSQEVKKDASKAGGTNAKPSQEVKKDPPKAGGTNAQPSQEVKKDASKAGGENDQNDGEPAVKTNAQNDKKEAEQDGGAKNQTDGDMKKVFIITTLMLLALVIIIFFSHISIRKIIRKEKDNNKKEINRLEETIKNIQQIFNEKKINISNNAINTQHTDNINTKYEILEGNVSKIQNELIKLGELKNKVDALYASKKMADNIASGNLGVTDAFNLWASNPHEPLPEAFYYIEGEINIRTECEIRESVKETKWITNRKGEKKYLFPNPNSFDQMTNLGLLYNYDKAKLKGRGQNKIKIIKPCEMSEDGFVEFAGEIELL